MAVPTENAMPAADYTSLGVEGLGDISEDIAIAPEATEDDIDYIIGAIARMETGEDIEDGEEREMLDEAPAPSAPRKLDGALGAARGPAAADDRLSKRDFHATRNARNALGERNMELLRAAVVAVGAKKAKRLTKRVIATQRGGGMKTADGSRKRTAGGVFFFLLREYMAPDAYKALMKADKKRKDRERDARFDAQRRKRPAAGDDGPRKRRDSRGDDS